MANHENPSAGKFGPPAPSEDRFSAPQPGRIARRLTRIGMAVALVRLLIEAYGGAFGRSSVLLVLVLVGLFVAEVVIDLKRADERPDGPYTPHARISR
jgi:hypothetical protein